MTSFNFIAFQRKSFQQIIFAWIIWKRIIVRRTIYKIKNVCTRMYQYYPFSNIINLTPIMSAMCWGRKGESVLEITSQFTTFYGFFNIDEIATHHSEITTLFRSKEKTNDLSTAFPKANLQLHASTDLCCLLYCWEIELVIYIIFLMY